MILQYYQLNDQVLKIKIHHKMVFITKLNTFKNVVFTLFVTNKGFPPICDWTTRKVCGWLVSQGFKRSFIDDIRLGVCYKNIRLSFISNIV